MTISYWYNLTTRATILGTYCCVTKDCNLTGLRPTYYFTVSVGQAAKHRLIGSLKISQGCNQCCPGLAAVSFDTQALVPSTCGCWQDSLSSSYRTYPWSLLSKEPAEDNLFLKLELPLKVSPDDVRPVHDNLHFWLTHLQLTTWVGISSLLPHNATQQ